MSSVSMSLKKIIIMFILIILIFVGTIWCDKILNFKSTAVNVSVQTNMNLSYTNQCDNTFFYRKALYSFSIALQRKHCQPIRFSRVITCPEPLLLQFELAFLFSLSSIFMHWSKQTNSYAKIKPN